LELKRTRIGIQGIGGSFHELAAYQYFEGQQIEIVQCDSFKKEFDALSQSECDWIVVAIENTLAGSILTNYTLLENSEFQIVGETYLGVSHCLMDLPGQKIKEFESVFSHPMALLQCDDFLSQFHGMESIGKKDTASSAKEISDKKLMKTAAIGSKGAAEKFGLEIYASDIQTHKLNFTRFLIIGPKEKKVEGANKASIVLQIEDKPGSLQQVLETFTRFEINLTKIQSIPIIGKPYAYSFHFDLEWQLNTPWRLAIEEVKQKITGFKNLGVYKRGNRSDIVK